MTQDLYTMLLEQGAPVLNPQTPEDEDQNFKYEEKLASAKQAMLLAEEELYAPQPLKAEDLSNDPELNTLYAGMLTGGMVGLRQTIKERLDPPADVLGSESRPSFSNPLEVEEDPVKAGILGANLEGFDPAIQSRLLNVYKDALDEGGSKQDAYRRMLLYRRDTLNGPGETGWPEFPNGAPNEKFWDRYLATANGTSDNPELSSKILKEQYNSYRTKGIPAYTEEELSGEDAVSQVKQSLHKLRFDGKGPLDSFDAYTAMQAFDRARVTAGGSDARRRNVPQRATLDFDLMTGAIAGPLAPLSRGILGGVAGVGTILASRQVQSELPEGTPDAVRTAIDFGIYSVGNRGSMLNRIRQGAEIGLAAGVGSETAHMAGGPDIIGAFAGPVLSPGMGAIARRQFQFLAEQAARDGVNPAELNKAMSKLAIDLTPDDIGKTVAIGDSFGTVDGMAGKDMLNITLEGGLQVTVRRDEVLHLPGAGISATVKSEATRLKNGGNGPDYDMPLVMSEEALDQLAVGKSFVHYTDSANIGSIMADGFRPTKAATGTLPGVYAFDEVNSKAASNRVALTPDAQSSAVFLEVPNGRIATPEQVREVEVSLGGRDSPEDMQRLATELQRRGFDGAQVGMNKSMHVIFDPARVKPRLAAEVGTTWDDFVGFAKGVMEGKARVQMVASVSGAGSIQGLSKEANMLIAAVTSNAFDYRMLGVALRAGSKPKNLPVSPLAAVYTFARSAVGMNPGLRRRIQPAVFAAANYAEADQVLVSTRMVTLQKAVKESFGPSIIREPEGRHFMAQYKGPPLTGAASDYVVGTLAHVIDQKALYNLSDTQSEVIDLWQSLLRADAKVTERAGVKFDLIEREYIPYKRKDVPPTFSEGLFAPQMTGRGTGRATPDFAKQRANKTLTDWASYLSATSEQVELDPFKLYLARLQGTAKLRADQVLLRSIVKAHGQRIDFPQQEKALREALSRTKAQLKGRLTTAIRQQATGSAQGVAFERLNRLLAQTESALQKVDNDLFNTSPITSSRWFALEGMLKALDKEADRIAAAAQTTNESMQHTAAKLANTKSAIHQIQGQVKNLQEKVSIRSRASAPSGWSEVGMGRLDGRYAVPEDIAREMSAVLNPKDAGDVVVRVQQTMQFFRSILLSADASFFTQQGYALAVTDPAKFLGNFGELIRVSQTEEGFTTYMARNLDAFIRFAQAGGTLYTRANDVVQGAGKKGLIDHLPPFAQINEFGYGRYLPVLKMQQFTTLVNMLDNVANDKTLLQQVFAHTPFAGAKANQMLRKFAGVEGKSAQQLMEIAADTVNNIGGGINYAKLMTQPSLASQMVFLTEGWMRANVGRIVQSAKVGDPAGVLARRWMFQNLAVSAGISTFLSLMFAGRTPNYDPMSPDFLDIQVGSESDLEGGSIPFLPGKTYIRAVFQGIAGVPWETEDSEIEQRVGALTRFGAGRTGQILRLGADLERGTDYLGRPIDNKLMYVARNMIPIAGQNAIDAAGGYNTPQALVTGLGAAGLNWVPNNPYDVRDVYVQQEGLVDPISRQPLKAYGELTDAQRGAFDAKNPHLSEAVHRWQDERDSPYAALRATRDSHRAAVVALGKAFQGEPLTEEERTLMGSEGANIEQIKGQPRLYRQMLGSLADYYRQEAEKQGGGQGDFTPTTPSQEVVTGYYKEVIDASRLGGQLDYATMDANERAYRRKVEEKYGEAGLRTLDEELLYRTTDDPVAQAYHKDQQLWNPYFEFLDSFWSPENLQSAGFSEEAAATAAQFPNRELYQGWLTEAYTDKLAGQALPSNLHNYRTYSGADTIGTRWGIIPGKRLTEQQAQDIAEELVRIHLKPYQERIGIASDEYLKQNNEALCAMSYWEITEPTEALKPYLLLCTTGGP